jgi:hypothetical protein
MKKKTKELVLIKSGEYMLDMSKLVFSGSVAVVLTAILGMFLTSKSQSNKKKGE